jgi:hypothetical protein
MTAAARVRNPAQVGPFLVRQDFGVGQAVMVVDGHVHVVEAQLLVRGTVVGGALRGVCSPAPTGWDLPKFFHVDVDHVPGFLTFIAAVRGPGRPDPYPGDRIHVPQPRQGGAGQDPGHGPSADPAAPCQIKGAFPVFEALGQDIQQHPPVGFSGAQRLIPEVADPAGLDRTSPPRPTLRHSHRHPDWFDQMLSGADV